MFVIVRVNSISGSVKYLTENLRWSKFLHRALLFSFSFDADDFLSSAFRRSPPVPFYYEVWSVRPVSSVGGIL